jgi:hypothetical protein
MAYIAYMTYIHGHTWLYREKCTLCMPCTHVWQFPEQEDVLTPSALLLRNLPRMLIMKQMEIYLEVPDNVEVPNVNVGLVCPVCGRTWGIKLYKEFGVWIAQPRQFICKVCSPGRNDKYESDPLRPS